MMIIESMSNPRWADAEQSAVELDVQFADGDGIERMVARADDAPTSGYFSQAIAGEFGPVGEYTPPLPLIPSVVSRKQARMALVLSGVPLASVQSAIDAITDDTERALAQIAWDDATEFRRDDAILGNLAAALGLTEVQLDGLFSLAATL